MHMCSSCQQLKGSERKTLLLPFALFVVPKVIYMHVLVLRIATTVVSCALKFIKTSNSNV